MPTTAISTENAIRPSSTPATRALLGRFVLRRLPRAAASPAGGAACASAVRVRRRREARLEEVLDRVAAAERRRNADEPGDDRADGQRHQRERHRASATRAGRATARGRGRAVRIVSCGSAGPCVTS